MNIQNLTLEEIKEKDINLTFPRLYNEYVDLLRQNLDFFVSNKAEKEAAEAKKKLETVKSDRFFNYLREKYISHLSLYTEEEIKFKVLAEIIGIKNNEFGIKMVQDVDSFFKENKK